MDLGRLGLSTFLHPGMDLWRWLSLAGKLGLGGVELRADPGAAHPEDLDSKERRRLRKISAELGLWLTAHVPIYDVNLACPIRSLAASALREMLETVNLAAEVGADLVVVHPGHVHEDYLGLDGEYERAWRRFALGMELLLSCAQERGISLVLENKQRSRVRDLILTAEEHARALERFPGLGACLDLGHLHTTGEDFRPYLAALGNRLLHVHLHDNRGERDEHLPLGGGSAPWQAFMADLAGQGYRGRIILEIPDPEALEASAGALTRVA